MVKILGGVKMCQNFWVVSIFLGSQKILGHKIFGSVKTFGWSTFFGVKFFEGQIFLGKKFLGGQTL